MKKTTTKPTSSKQVSETRKLTLRFLKTKFNLGRDIKFSNDDEFVKKGVYQIKKSAYDNLKTEEQVLLDKIVETVQ